MFNNWIGCICLILLVVILLLMELISMDGPFVELGIYLKIKNVVSTGGQAKILIRSGAVLVNGNIEMQVRKKLVVGDTIVSGSLQFVVEKEVLR